MESGLENVSGDPGLVRAFERQILSSVPHLEGASVVNVTPLVDLTDALLSCASAEYGLHPAASGVRVFAKLDSQIKGGSVKVRAAVGIIEAALLSGSLRKGQAVFEATSGNFGLALGMLGGLGLDVIALVSRRLQQGVIDQLSRDCVKLINLDVDICPAPGFKGSADMLVAKAAADSVRRQLEDLGFDPGAYDAVREEAEAILSRQDAIGFAKFLAKTYHGFCTEQYENPLNVEAHRTVTGPEVDRQLHEVGTSLGEVDFVCAFGTGGTAGGTSRYIESTYGRKGVRVVFPLSGQDVAGIRTKEKSVGLPFYSPEAYLGEHEVDFEEASRVFEFFNKKGYDIGESGALALYACMQLINFGVGKRFVVMVADGASKYRSEVEAVARRGRRDQVRLDEAASAMAEYGGVIWAHNMFVPKVEGIRAIASSLGCDESTIRVAGVADVQAVLNGREPSGDFEALLPKDDRPVLVVCMAGNTSLMLAKVLERRGVAAESLVGGITGLPAAKGKQPTDLVQIARA
jgi:cysteine synthase/rhodanese-related sulfurtransferase